MSSVAPRPGGAKAGRRGTDAAAAAAAARSGDDDDDGQILPRRRYPRRRDGEHAAVVAAPPPAARPLRRGGGAEAGSSDGSRSGSVAPDDPDRGILLFVRELLHAEARAQSPSQGIRELLAPVYRGPDGANQWALRKLSDKCMFMDNRSFTKEDLRALYLLANGVAPKMEWGMTTLVFHLREAMRLREQSGARRGAASGAPPRKRLKLGKAFVARSRLPSLRLADPDSVPPEPDERGSPLPPLPS